MSSVKAQFRMLNKLKYCSPQKFMGVEDNDNEEPNPFIHPWSSKYAYLGQNFMNPSSHVASKVNPNKTTHTIEGLQAGLKNCIRIIRDEIELCSGEIQNQQTSKSLHLQLKTLEYQQSRLENLQENYVLQQKLREGVRTMAYAYTLSNGKDKELALANVKAGFRECTEALGSLESQVQEFLGGFHLTMKGIQGFARLCPGDVYEITVKHGAQKWKTRAKVNKEGSQNWDFPEARVTAILGEDLYIKAAEIKTLGKQILLGNKFCEICELFSSHPQLMTVNLNPSGSLKLNIVVQWDPLAQFYEEVNSPLRKRRMMISPTLLKHSRSQKWPKLKEISEPEEELKESLNKLAGILCDEIQGQYPELEACEVNIAALRRIAFQEYHRGDDKPNERCSRSTSSLNIESALECFDFLDSCDVYSPPPIHRHLHHSSIGLYPLEEDTKTATTDSGISSLNSRSPSPEATFVTGSEQLDLALSTHVQICLKLVNNLGTFGPLKWKEKNALNKLQQQGIILGNILNRINEKDDYIFELEGVPFIQKLWMDITQSSHKVVITVDQAAYGLEREIRKFNENSHNLSKSLVLQMLDENIYRRHAIISVFQFLMFLKPYENSFQRLVTDIAEEELVLQRLTNPNRIEETVNDLRNSGGGSVPSKAIFVSLARLLSHEDMEIQEVVTQYFLEISDFRRRQMIENCLELLESENPSDRHSSIILLTLLNASETLEEVAYLAQTDEEPRVRDLAKQMLMSQGDKGDRMHTQLTLNSHGFQGLLAN